MNMRRVDRPEEGAFKIKVVGEILDGIFSLKGCLEKSHELYIQNAGNSVKRAPKKANAQIIIDISEKAGSIITQDYINKYGFNSKAIRDANALVYLCDIPHGDFLFGDDYVEQLTNMMSEVLPKDAIDDEIGAIEGSHYVHVTNRHLKREKQCRESSSGGFDGHSSAVPASTDVPHL